MNKPRSLNRTLLALAAGLLVVACDQAEKPNGSLPDLSLRISGKYDINTNKIQVALTPPNLADANWTGYELWMSQDTNITYLDTLKIQRSQIPVTGLVSGQPTILSVNPGSGIGARKFAITLMYQKAGEDFVRRTRLSNVIAISTDVRANLGCGDITSTARNHVALCLDSGLVRTEGGKPYFRNAVVPANLFDATPAQQAAALGFDKSDIPLYTGGVTVKNRKFILDSVVFTPDQITKDSLGLVLTVLVQYQAFNTLHNASNPDGYDRVTEVAHIRYDKSTPNVSVESDTSAGAFTLRSTSSPTGDIKYDKQNYPANLILNDVIHFSVPPNSPGVKDEFRVRILYPIQAPTEDAALYTSGPVLGYRKTEWQGFPYNYVGGPVVPDSSLQNLLRPGGYVAFPWHTAHLKDGGDSITISKYVKEFNDQGGGAWRDTLGGAPASGTFTFAWDPFLDTVINGYVRKIDRSYPPRLPLYTFDLAGGLTQKIGSGTLVLPFYQMPTWWANRRRTRSFVIQFEFTGQDFPGDIRDVYSFELQDLSFSVAAPSVDIVGDHSTTGSGDSRHTTPGALHLEGLINATGSAVREKPVSRNISYDVNVLSIYPTERFELMAYYSRIPDEYFAQYIQPVIDAFQAGNFPQNDILAYKILHDLVDSARVMDVASDGVNVIVKPKSGTAPLNQQTSYTVDFNTDKWRDGVYILWFAAADRDFVSGPLLAGKPGPAMPSGSDMPAFDPKPNSYNPVGTDPKAARRLVNPRIFRFQR